MSFYCPKCKRHVSKMNIIETKEIPLNVQEKLIDNHFSSKCLAQKLICFCGKELYWSDLMSVSLVKERNVVCSH